MEEREYQYYPVSEPTEYVAKHITRQTIIEDTLKVPIIEK